MELARLAAEISRPPRAGSHCLTFGDTRIALGSQLPQLLDWLLEALAPGFTVESSVGEPDIVIEILDGASAEPPAAAEELPCFVLESERVRLPCLDEGDRVTVIPPERGARARLEPGRATIWACDPDELVRPFVMRVVREIVLARELAAGQAQLHAACLELEGRCLAFAGPKRAGKTTTTARIAVSTGSPIVAGDRVLVRRRAGGCAAIGIPTFSSVRAETLELFRGRFATIPDITWPSRLTRAEAARELRRAGPLRSPRVLHLLNSQLAHQLGVPTSRGGQLSCVALLEVAEQGEFELEPLGGRAAAAAVAELCFGTPRSAAEVTVFDRMFGTRTHGPGPPVSLFEGVPAVRLRVGPEFLGSATAPGRLARSLLEAR